MTTTCKYCKEPENKQERPGLVCETCFSFVHLTCLRRLSTPGDFASDVFFNYTCEDCSPIDKELFYRRKFPWVNVILLTLHHLNTHSYGMSNKGFFHYKTHIGSFIDRNWNLLFDSTFKQKKNWLGTIAGILSVYNGLLLYSGSEVLREGGWWMLLHNFSPAVGAHIVQELGRDKPKWRSKCQLSLHPNLFFDKVTEMGYKDLLNEDLLTVINDEIPMKKLKRSDSDDASGPSFSDNFETSYEPSNEFQSHDTYFTTTTAKGYPEMEISPLYKSSNYVPNQSDTSSVHSAQQYTHQYDSESPLPSPATAVPHETSDENEAQPHKPRKLEKEKICAQPLIRESLFSAQLNSVELPWEESEVKADPTLVPLTEYEEIQLLNKVSSMIPKVRDPNRKADLRSFRAKLATRRIKRHRHIPLFDFDRNVKILGGYVTEEFKTITTTDRVLDRFQRSYLIDNLSGTISGADNPTLIISHIPPVPFRSSYSGTLLKPYVRIDSTSKPLWLQVQEELLKKTNGADYVFEKADIEYSYVRPQHIAAINALCAQHFWQGIDVSECLQYPEFSCVVTYKRLVIGAAFLVPNGRDVYISFLCTRVEWRRAGIASFMLYHLLQTCTEKDVTLHVSPTNPAIFLYQKFGFKVEELIQDFYEKYFDVHYKGCRHALFLRLVR